LSGNFFLPDSTKALILKEREKMLNNVVGLIGKMSEEVVANMNGVVNGNAENSNAENSSVENPHAELEEVVTRLLDAKFKSILHDIDYRINVLYDAAARATGEEAGKVGTRDLSLAHHLLDGFTFTNNSPSSGSVAWSDCHIVYKGVNYTITDDDTAYKYIWWDFDASPNTVFQTSNTKPSLTADDVLVAINDNGIAQLMITPGKMVHGGALINGSVGTSEIGDGAVNSDKIAALAVLESKLASSAVTSAKLSNGAVTAGKLANGAIDQSSRFASGVVDSNALANSAVTADKIGNGQVTGPKIGAGEIAETKLNLASHLLF